MRIIGIDISKQWFDCFCRQRGIRQRFANTEEGWERLGEWAGTEAWMVMEASGPYYLGLASWLHARGCSVSVVNPLVIRRYGQMKLARTKTDAKDAELIAAYGAEQRPGPWSPPGRICQQMRQLMSLREGLLRQRSILAGQTEAFGGVRQADPLVGEILTDEQEQLQKNIARIDRRLEALADAHYETAMKALQSIPGVGRKTAILLVCLTDGFARFASAHQLASYAGICPRIWESGTSLKGRGAICKLGCPQLHKLLYMCAWTAKSCNPGCRRLYERLKAQGKPEKVIKVAIAHKLLRQAFAVGKTGELFNVNKAMAA